MASDIHEGLEVEVWTETHGVVLAALDKAITIGPPRRIGGDELDRAAKTVVADLTKAGLLPQPAPATGSTPAQQSADVVREADAATGALGGARGVRSFGPCVESPGHGRRSAECLQGIGEECVDHGCFCGCHVRRAPEPPRTWALPAEPGPEVTAVRATQPLYSDFTLWLRISAHDWQLTRNDGVGLTITDWRNLLLYGPLTDATHEERTDAQPS